MGCGGDDKVRKVILYLRGKRKNLDKNIVNFFNYCKRLEPKGEFAKAVAPELIK